MDRPIPTYEEVKVIVAVLLSLSLISALMAGAFVKQREMPLWAAAFAWLSIFLMVLALNGDVMFSILRAIQTEGESG